MVRIDASEYIVWFSFELEVSDLNEPSGCIRANAFVLKKHNTLVTLNALWMHPVEHYVKHVQARIYKQGVDSGPKSTG